LTGKRRIGQTLTYRLRVTILVVEQNVRMTLLLAGMAGVLAAGIGAAACGRR